MIIPAHIQLCIDLLTVARTAGRRCWKKARDTTCLHTRWMRSIQTVEISRRGQPVRGERIVASSRSGMHVVISGMMVSNCSSRGMSRILGTSGLAAPGKRQDENAHSTNSVRCRHPTSAGKVCLTPGLICLYGFLTYLLALGCSRRRNRVLGVNIHLNLSLSTLADASRTPYHRLQVLRKFLYSQLDGSHNRHVARP